MNSKPRLPNTAAWIAFWKKWWIARRDFRYRDAV